MSVQNPFLGKLTNDISGFPSRDAHSCKNGAGIVNVQLNDSLAKWQSATTTAHKLIHLTAWPWWWEWWCRRRTCRKESGYLMGPSQSYTHLYRICKNKELWSRCTKKQVAQFTSNWDNVCPSSPTKSWYEHILLWREYILWGYFIALVLDLAYGGVLVYRWKKGGSYKLSEGKGKEMITGLSYSRDLTDNVASSSVEFLGNCYDLQLED